MRYIRKAIYYKVEAELLFYEPIGVTVFRLKAQTFQYKY